MRNAYYLAGAARRFSARCTPGNDFILQDIKQQRITAKQWDDMGHTLAVTHRVLN